MPQDWHERTRADGWSWQNDDAKRWDVWDIHGHWYGNTLLIWSLGFIPECPDPAIPPLYNNKIFRYLEVRALDETAQSYPLCSADCKHTFCKISFFPSFSQNNKN